MVVENDSKGLTVVLDAAQAEMKVKELGVANRLLRSQLADTTLSFRNALETTHRFLLEGQRAS